MITHGAVVTVSLLFVIHRKLAKLSWRTTSQKTKRKIWTWIKMPRNLVRFIPLLQFSLFLRSSSKGPECTYKLVLVFQVMTKKRAVAARQKTPAVNRRGETKIRTRGKRTTRTEGSAGARRAAVGARAARSGPEKCETRSSEVTTTTMTATMSKRTLAEAAGRTAVEARMKEGTEAAAGAAAPPRHAAIAVAGTRRGVRVEVTARGDQTPAMQATVNKMCRVDKMSISLWCMFVFKDVAALCQ